MKLKVRVKSPHGEVFPFEIQAHERKNGEFKLSDLYQEAGQKFSSTYELEIMNEKEINKQNTKKLALHIHQGSDQREYVCYPLQITNEEVKNIVRMWSLISAFQMDTGVDANWFESFGNFLIKKIQSENVNVFASVPEWILSLGWSIEIV